MAGMINKAISSVSVILIHLFEVEPCIDFIYSDSGDLKLAGLRQRDKSVGRGWSLRAGPGQAPPVLALVCLARSSQSGSREHLAH